MAEPLIGTVLLPLGLGLLGFIEPCSIGSTLIFIKAMEGRSAAVKLLQVAVFTATRAVFIGTLGAAAALIGSMFIAFQKSMWTALGIFYVVLGVLYLTGRAGLVMTALGPGLARIGEVRGSALLGVLFGLNIPACAAPLLFALLGTAAAGGVSAGALAYGFGTLAIFGFALSLPLAIAVLFPAARRALDALAGLSRRMPRWAGIVLLGLGLWSIWFGVFVAIDKPA